MKVYISGKITGLPHDQVVDSFNRAEYRLLKAGFKAVNPLNNGLSIEDKWEHHMKADIKMLMDCDAIYLMKNWKHSKGARIERELADNLGYVIIEQE